MPTREQIAQAIHDSCPHYIGSMGDCLKAADAVIGLSKPIKKLSDKQMQEIEDRWDTASLQERLAWYNGISRRPGCIGRYVKDILALANELAAISSHP